MEGEYDVLLGVIGWIAMMFFIGRFLLVNALRSVK